MNTPPTSLVRSTRQGCLSLFFCTVALAGLRFCPTADPADQGGIRLLYSLDFAEALRLGRITETEFASPQSLMARTVQVVQRRVDPGGRKGARVLIKDDSHFLLEFPRSLARGPFEYELTLENDLDESSRSLTVRAPGARDLDGQWVLREFPVEGGSVRIEGERIRYLTRGGGRFGNLERGFEGTLASRHPAGATVALDRANLVRHRVENIGEIVLYEVADPVRDFPETTDETQERRRVEAWIRAHPGASITEFNSLDRALGGPPSSLCWFPLRLDDIVQARHGATLADRLVPLARGDHPARVINRDIGRIYHASDEYGYPVAHMEFSPDLRATMTNWLDEDPRLTLAIVMNDEILTFRSGPETTEDPFVLTGGPDGLSMMEVDTLLMILRAGRLPVLPRLESEELIEVFDSDER